MPRLVALQLIPLTAALLAASLGGDAASQKDLNAMQGTWKVVGLTENGQQLPPKEVNAVTVLIIADRMSLHDENKFREEIAMKLDASKKIKAVDFVYTEGPNTGKREQGIYAIDGDVLKFCVNESKDGPRPTEFVSTKENKCSVAVLQRVKK